MKELSIEEKAKAYDNAVINGSRLWECGGISRENYEYIFHELKESEDERIRKEIIRFIRMEVEDEIVGNKWLAWLEKQKEPELSEDLGEYVAELSKQFPEVSFAKLSRIAVRVKNWFEKQGENKDLPNVTDRETLDEYSYQVAYDLSNDWLKDTATWDDVETACKLGAKWYEEHHKSTWSEKDEIILDGIILRCEKYGYQEQIDWLKSLKVRIGG